MKIQHADLCFLLDMHGARDGNVAVQGQDGEWRLWHFCGRGNGLSRKARMEAEATLMLEGGIRAVKVRCGGGTVVSYGPEEAK